MPRSARFIAPGVVHHITQRGIDRQSVFHARCDRLTYLRLLREQAAVRKFPILAYCLMSNHIHLIAVPHEVPVLAEVMQRVHGRYGTVSERSPGVIVGTSGRTGSILVRWAHRICGRPCAMWK
ncbi:transposase [uncultured Paludibaculum sp.]|uniref:transposase n=1 Tax=uncultured Paludibaculum sp. TaxID=1765020 RepID=UPI00374CBBA1